MMRNLQQLQLVCIANKKLKGHKIGAVKNSKKIISLTFCKNLLFNLQERILYGFTWGPYNKSYNDIKKMIE